MSKYEELKITAKTLNEIKNIESNLKILLEKPIYSCDKYSIYESGIIGKKLLGYTTKDAIVDMAMKCVKYENIEEATE